MTADLGFLNNHSIKDKILDAQQLYKELLSSNSIFDKDILNKIFPNYTQEEITLKYNSMIRLFYKRTRDIKFLYVLYPDESDDFIKEEHKQALDNDERRKKLEEQIAKREEDCPRSFLDSPGYNALPRPNKRICLKLPKEERQAYIDDYFKYNSNEKKNVKKTLSIDNEIVLDIPFVEQTPTEKVVFKEIPTEKVVTKTIPKLKNKRVMKKPVKKNTPETNAEQKPTLATARESQPKGR